MGNGDPPLKIKISKIGLRHVLSWPKLGLEPKFHELGTFGGFGKSLSDIKRMFNTGPYEDLEPKSHDHFWWLRKTRTNRQTDKIHGFF